MQIKKVGVFKLKWEINSSPLGKIMIKMQEWSPSNNILMILTEIVLEFGLYAIKWFVD